MIKRDQVINSAFNAPFPKNRYVLRGIKSTTGISKSSGNPMATIEVEIVCNGSGNDIVEFEGQKVNVAGRKFVYYLVYTEENAQNVFDFFNKLNQPIEEFDPQNPPNTDFIKGLTFDAILSTQPNIPRHPPGPGKKVGDPIKDANGKDIVNGYSVSNQLSDILGLAEIPTKSSEDRAF